MNYTNSIIKMIPSPTNFHEFPNLTNYSIFWWGQNIYQYKSDYIWKLVAELQKEGIKRNTINPDTQFPEFEATSVDLLIAVAFYLSFIEGKCRFQSNHVFDEIVQLYNNSDMRLLKINFN